MNSAEALQRIPPLLGVFPGKRHPSQVVVGYDLRLRALGEPRGLRRPGQHVLHLQFEKQGREREGDARAGSAHG